MATRDKYEEMKTRDITIVVATKLDSMKESIDLRLEKLEKESDVLHDKISQANEQADRKVTDVHRRIDRIRWWSIGSGGIGGFIGALLAFIRR